MTRHWYLGADHAGFSLKQRVLALLQARGERTTDLGTHDETSVDYPDFGRAVGEKVAAEPGSLGVVVCGSGIGISIAANKVPGIRAALCTHQWMAQMAREHNDANVLALGARVVGAGLAEAIVEAFATAVFAGGRHQQRVDKLHAGERPAVSEER